MGCSLTWIIHFFKWGTLPWLAGNTSIQCWWLKTHHSGLTRVCDGLRGPSLDRLLADWWNETSRSHDGSVCHICYDYMVSHWPSIYTPVLLAFVYTIHTWVIHGSVIPGWLSRKTRKHDKWNDFRCCLLLRRGFFLAKKWYSWFELFLAMFRAIHNAMCPIST